MGGSGREARRSQRRAEIATIGGRMARITIIGRGGVGCWGKQAGLESLNMGVLPIGAQPCQGQQGQDTHSCWLHQRTQDRIRKSRLCPSHRSMMASKFKGSAHREQKDAGPRGWEKEPVIAAGRFCSRSAWVRDHWCLGMSPSATTSLLRVVPGWSGAGVR